jgi:hypothetical protein
MIKVYLHKFVSRDHDAYDNLIRYSYSNVRCSDYCRIDSDCCMPVSNKNLLLKAHQKLETQ